MISDLSHESTYLEDTDWKDLHCFGMDRTILQTVCFSFNQDKEIHPISESCHTSVLLKIRKQTWLNTRELTLQRQLQIVAKQSPEHFQLDWIVQQLNNII